MSYKFFLFAATTVNNIDASEIVSKDCVDRASRLLEVSHLHSYDGGS